ncbi:TPA: VENN motif pre-toxin domain-containing protein, partial [Proteus mirabilis]|nr:VENN motif pre-toxin domain-containing protein [Escherichia coli]HEH1509478.1 VENN motif pre-toxin domain-containing protein [Proteus mirabilis]
HSTLNKIFDKDKEQNRVKEQQLLGEIGVQVRDIARTEATIRATEKAKADFDIRNYKQDDIDKAKAELIAEGKSAGDRDITALLFNKEVEKNLAESGFGTGGKYTRAMQAATAAVQGVMGGDLKAALANGAAPFIANEIKKQIPDEEADANLKRTIAHGIANAALALAKGENVAAQATGAMTGEAIGILAESVYHKKAHELTEREKENVSAWATLASGLAGGLAGGDTQSVANAAQAGKTTVENNYLTGADKREADEKYVRCNGDKDCQLKVVRETNELSQRKDDELLAYKQQLVREMGKEMEAAVIACQGDMECQRKEYATIKTDYDNRYREHVKIVTENTSLGDLDYQYYPDNTRVESVIDGVVNTGPEKVVDLATNVTNYVTNHSASEMLGDTLQVGKIVIGIPQEWLSQDIPAQSLEKALFSLGVSTGHEIGEATFYNMAGTSVVSVGGKALQWSNGKWIPVKIGNLEPGNPLSTSIVRNGDRLVLNQGNLPTCGPNSCAMVMNTSGLNYDLGKLITDAKVTPQGARMNNLASAMRNQGFADARFISRVSVEELAVATSKGNPAIVAMKLDRGGHAVVVDGITVRNGQTVVAIRDPALGRQYFTPIDEFKNKYMGQAIITSPKK